MITFYSLRQDRLERLDRASFSSLPEPCRRPLDRPLRRKRSGRSERVSRVDVNPALYARGNTSCISGEGVLRYG